MKDVWHYLQISPELSSELSFEELQTEDGLFRSEIELWERFFLVAAVKTWTNINIYVISEESSQTIISLLEEKLFSVKNQFKEFRKFTIPFIMLRCW